jgi:hypothetical protein
MLRSVWAQGRANENKLLLDGMLVRDLMTWPEVGAKCASCSCEELVPLKAVERSIGSRDAA